MDTCVRTIPILGVAGPSASGKSTFARAVRDALGDVACVMISHDDYYRDLSHLPLEERAATNFDHPDALETELLVEHLRALRRGESVEKPQYDFMRHCRRPETEVIGPAAVVIVEGILALAVAALRECLDLRVYVDEAADVCLARRVLRDVRESGRSVEAVVEQYLRFVRPMQEQFVLPSRAYADIVVVLPGELEARAAETAQAVLSSLGEA